jgi:dihydrofolate reductase
LAKLTFSALASLDGFVADESGNFDWAAPDEEVHAFVNDLERGVGTYLYGRRMYEVMAYWETADSEGSGVHADYARIWQSADKVVYSRSLATVDTPRTRLLPELDVQALRRQKESAAADLSIGGPTLAAAAMAAGLVDEVALYLHPVSVGGGTPALPVGTRVGLDLAEQHTFSDGVVLLRYEVGVR